MLGRDADAIFWLFRYIERSENLATLLDTFFGLMLTDFDGLQNAHFFLFAVMGENMTDIDQLKKTDLTRTMNLFLRNENRTNSMPFLLKQIKENARVARTSLSSDLWKAINDYWLYINDIKRVRIKEGDVPQIISDIKIRNSLVRGAFNGSLLRDERFYFGSLGTYMERADNTARVLEIKLRDSSIPQTCRYGLVKKKSWEIVLKLVQAYNSYGWLNKGKFSSIKIAKFLISDARMPRSLFYCSDSIYENILNIVSESSFFYRSLRLSKKIRTQMLKASFNNFESIQYCAADYIVNNRQLLSEIEKDFRFVEH